MVAGNIEKDAPSSPLMGFISVLLLTARLRIMTALKE